MPFDPQVDERRWRLFLLGAAALAGAALTLVAWREAARSPAAEQAAAVAAGVISEVVGPVEVRTCSGELDRCQSCHLGAERRDLDHAELPLLLRSHALSLADHPPERFGCAVCHGGTPRALDQAAHEVITGERDPLLVAPWTEAACAQCHLPGAVAGTERLARGVDLYLRLGCAMCHPLAAGGRGGWDFGPDLRRSGRHSLDYLRDSLFEPTKNFAGSTMPSYRHSFTDEPQAAEDLLLFVVALSLPRHDACGPGDPSGVEVDAPCARCHAGAGGAAGGRFTHRCVFINGHGELRCAGCHPGEVPPPGAGGGFCPVVREQRSACAACHDRATGR